MNTPDASPTGAVGQRELFGMAIVALPATAVLLVAAGSAIGATGGSRIVLIGALAMATILLAFRCFLRPDRRVVAVLLGLLAVTLAAAILTAPISTSWLPHMLQVGGVLLGVAAIGGAILGYAGVLRPGPAMLGPLAVAGVLLLAEAMSAALPQPWVGVAGPQRDGLPIVNDSALGTRLPVDTTLTTRYDFDPRDYFHPVDLRRDTWTISTQPGNAAQMVFPEDAPRVIRMEIDSASPGPGWHIHLTQPGYAVQQLQGYTVGFRIRADSTRSVGVGVVQAHDPWQMVGFYRDVEASPEWSSHEIYFEADRTDDNVRIEFALGGNDISTEVADVELRDNIGQLVLPSGIEPRYQVAYRTDRLGCRRTGASSPTPEGARLLFLGGSATFGVDLHAEDVFTAILAVDTIAVAAGAGEASRPWQVINCSTPAGGSDEWLPRVRGLVEPVRPRAVVVVVEAESDVNHRNAAVRRARKHAGPLARTSTLLMRWRVRRAVAAIDGAGLVAAELAEVAREVRSSGARMGVVLFRATEDPRWPALRERIDEAMRPLDVPVHDAGAALIDAHAPDVLVSFGTRELPSAYAHAQLAITLRPFIDSLLAQGSATP